MKKVLDFLRQLQQNNCKEWFDSHKSEYLEAREVFNESALSLIESLGVFDAGVRGVTLKESTYRIYRDVRFSADKTPYKTHIGLYVCPGGKKSGNAGYYLHVEPDKSLLAVGLHCPEPKVVKSVREDIFSLYNEFEKHLKAAKGFEMDFSSALKRTPREFPSDAVSAPYLRLKEYDLCMSITDAQITHKDMVRNVAAIFATAKPFNDFMSRAVNFARQENDE